jgi:hypothetical protein
MDKGRPKMMPRPNSEIAARKKHQEIMAHAVKGIGTDLSGFLHAIGGFGGHILGAMATGKYNITAEEAARQVRGVECVQPRPWRSWQHYWRRASSVNRSSRRLLRRKYEAAVQRANVSS